MPGSSSRSLSRRSGTGGTKSRSGGGGGGYGGGALRRRACFTTAVAALSITGADPVTATETLAAGANHACVITSTGGVKCWGSNSKGQLGYGDVVKRTAPPLEFVDLGDNRTAVSITAGDAHTCAVLDDGGLKVSNHGRITEQTRHGNKCCFDKHECPRLGEGLPRTCGVSSLSCGMMSHSSSIT